LASPADTAGPSDKWPVLVQHAGPGAWCDRARFTRWRILQRNAANVQLERCAWAHGHGHGHGPKRVDVACPPHVTQKERWASARTAGGGMGGSTSTGEPRCHYIGETTRSQSCVWPLGSIRRSPNCGAEAPPLRAGGSAARFAMVYSARGLRRSAIGSERQFAHGAPSQLHVRGVAAENPRRAETVRGRTTRLARNRLDRRGGPGRARCRMAWWPLREPRRVGR
jgi:hypothetical protein